MKKILSLILACASTPALSLEIGIPTTCDMNNECFIQYYMDHSTAPGMPRAQTEPLDYTCGHLAKRSYWGTDFRVSHYNNHRPPAVIASASGKVTAVRRDMPDRINEDVTNYGIPRGKEAGNSIIIDHGNGWQTQYNHLRFASILVTPGQKVSAGDKVAEIGSSGSTILPKLGFVVRHNEQPVDPFVGRNFSLNCGDTNGSIWNDEARQTLQYKKTGLARVGFSETVPEAHRLRSGLSIKNIRRKSPDSVVFWADLFGLRKDDILYMRMTDPTGQRFAEEETVIRGDYPQWLAYIGRRIGTGNLTTGVYIAEIVLQRGNTTLINETYNIELEGSRLPPNMPEYPR